MNTGSKNPSKDNGNLDILKLDWHKSIEAIESTGKFDLLETYKSDMMEFQELSQTKIVWIQGVHCTGCSCSLLEASNPELIQALEILNIDISFHETLLQQQGIFVDGKPANTSELNSVILADELIEQKDYILVVEGSIANGPNGSGRYCMLGGSTSKELFSKAAQNSNLIIAVGMCATYGGINCASSEIADLMDFRGVAFTKKDPSKGMLSVLGIDKPVINIPGCPPHPDWILLTISALISGSIKVPDDLDKVLDKYGRPKVFFPPDYTIHDQCSHRGSFDRREFATHIGEDKCLIKLGCKGPSAHADCTLRKWNNGHNYCPNAGSPCVACVEPDFPDSARPVYTSDRKKKRGD